MWWNNLVILQKKHTKLLSDKFCENAWNWTQKWLGTWCLFMDKVSKIVYRRHEYALRDILSERMQTHGHLKRCSDRYTTIGTVQRPKKEESFDCRKRVAREETTD